MRWPFLLSLLGLDVLSKVLAIHYIPPLGGGSYPFDGIGIFSLGGITCSLNYIINTGAAWGIFAGHSGLLFTIRALIILALLFFVPKRFPIWLILIGAVGNVLDYALYGHVIDFIHFTFWGYSFPIFNIADSCITIGVCLLLICPEKGKSSKAI